jgi:hypothetical protein
MVSRIALQLANAVADWCGEPSAIVEENGLPPEARAAVAPAGDRGRVSRCGVRLCDQPTLDAAPPRQPDARP